MAKRKTKEEPAAEWTLISEEVFRCAPRDIVDFIVKNDITGAWSFTDDRLNVYANTSSMQTSGGFVCPIRLHVNEGIAPFKSLYPDPHPGYEWSDAEVRITREARDRCRVMLCAKSIAPPQANDVAFRFFAEFWRELVESAGGSTSKSRGKKLRLSSTDEALLKLWNQKPNLSINVIAERTHLSKGRIWNRVTELRNSLGEMRVPRRRQSA